MTTTAVPSRARVRSAVVVLALVAAGCGGEDADPTATPTAGSPTPAATTTGAMSPSPSAPEAGTTTSATASEPGADATGAEATGETYTVESGDTLTSIAQRFDTTVDAIVEANDLDDPDVIDIGQELLIPPSS